MSEGFTGHVVHSAGSGVRNVGALFFVLGGHGANPKNSAFGHVTPNLCFCFWWDVWVT
jgi:hypothetical protein